MKSIQAIAILTASLFTMACSDDNTVFNEPSPIRAYETDAEILIVAGVDTPQPCHSYIISNNGNSDWLSVKGMNLVGDGTLSVSFSQ